YTVTVAESNSTNTGAAGGRSVIIPQGTNNSRSLLLQGDGELNVDLAGVVNYADLGGAPPNSMSMFGSLPNVKLVPSFILFNNAASPYSIYTVPSNRRAILSSVMVSAMGGAPNAGNTVEYQTVINVSGTVYPLGNPTGVVGATSNSSGNSSGGSIN